MLKEPDIVYWGKFLFTLKWVLLSSSILMSAVTCLDLNHVQAFFFLAIGLLVTGNLCHFGQLCVNPKLVQPQVFLIPALNLDWFVPHTTGDTLHIWRYNLYKDIEQQKKKCSSPQLADKGILNCFYFIWRDCQQNYRVHYKVHYILPPSMSNKCLIKIPGKTRQKVHFGYCERQAERCSCQTNKTAVMFTCKSLPYAFSQWILISFHRASRGNVHILKTLHKLDIQNYSVGMSPATMVNQAVFQSSMYKGIWI